MWFCRRISCLSISHFVLSHLPILLSTPLILFLIDRIVIKHYSPIAIEFKFVILLYSHFLFFFFTFICLLLFVHTPNWRVTCKSTFFLLVAAKSLFSGSFDCPGKILFRSERLCETGACVHDCAASVCRTDRVWESAIATFGRASIALNAATRCIDREAPTYAVFGSNRNFVCRPLFASWRPLLLVFVFVFVFVSLSLSRSARRRCLNNARWLCSLGQPCDLDAIVNRQNANLRQRKNQIDQDVRLRRFKSNRKLKSC